ncbi:IclR family transcriptional regulator C-terminal domain-containing protein [Demequina sp. NBRC 110056]|uniref:IclR family transcriptional regulator domain-containing protein n=1 Tax=Demequina sp. NBRC 110056 TaxID=1570345 RepID=UPI000A0354BB|nr:IclR family transcriptional regulator C-terminal domain-containing protein [Demequina sp. NBRC 110056]
MDDSTAATSEDSATFVQSLARGLSVIRAFSGERPAMTLSEVAEHAGISRAAARRFLLTLESLGYVTSEARAYRLTPQVLELGVSYLSSLSLPEVAQPHLEALAAELGESVSAAVLDGARIVYVARAEARRIMSVRIAVGTHFPAHAAAMGRVLLASLPEDAWEERLRQTGLARLTSRTEIDLSTLLGVLRETMVHGWAAVDGELEEGLRSVAVPVRGPHGIVAAINVATGAGAPRDAETTEGFVHALQRTARAIEDEMRRVSLTHS